MLPPPLPQIPVKYNPYAKCRKIKNFSSRGIPTLCHFLCLFDMSIAVLILITSSPPDIKLVNSVHMTVRKMTPDRGSKIIHREPQYPRAIRATAAGLFPTKVPPSISVIQQLIELQF